MRTQRERERFFTPKAKPVPRAPAIKIVPYADQDSLHLFASMISLDDLHLCTDAGECELKKEGGWVLSSFLKLFLKIVGEVAEVSGVKRYMAGYLYRITELAKYDKNPRAILKDVADLKPNEYVWFPWGTSNHQIYLEIRRVKKVYHVKIFNLGAGLADADIVSGKAHPHRLDFHSLATLTVYLNKLLTFNNKPVDNGRVYFTGGKSLSEEEFYTQVVYDNKRKPCTDICPAEYTQNTGNCVVKNLLFLTYQDCCDIFEDGSAFYNQIYLLLVETALREALTTSVDETQQLMLDSDEVCLSIQTSQDTFLGVGCDVIKTIMDTVSMEEGRSLASRARVA